MQGRRTKETYAPPTPTDADPLSADGADAVLALANHRPHRPHRTTPRTGSVWSVWSVVGPSRSRTAANRHRVRRCRPWAYSASSADGKGVVGMIGGGAVGECTGKRVRVF